MLDERTEPTQRRATSTSSSTPPAARGRSSRSCSYRLDINTLHRDETAHGLSLNEIGRVRLRTTAPLFFDEYRRNRITGSFILMDEARGNTVGAGMILGPPGVSSRCRLAPR